MSIIVPESEHARLRDLKGNITMVMYPKEDLTNRTPSPVTAALALATNDLRDLRAKAVLESLVGKPTVTPGSKPRQGEPNEQSGEWFSIFRVFHR
jgi:hypothetical protein